MSLLVSALDTCFWYICPHIWNSFIYAFLVKQRFYAQGKQWLDNYFAQHVRIIVPGCVCISRMTLQWPLHVWIVSCGAVIWLSWSESSLAGKPLFIFQWMIVPNYLLNSIVFTRLDICEKTYSKIQYAFSIEHLYNQLPKCQQLVPARLQSSL